MIIRLVNITGLFLLLIACQKEAENIEVNQEKLLEIPEGFPAPEFPVDNGFTESRWKLGKMLFFDKRLSKDETISCSSCHLPAFAFSDTVKFSAGVALAPGTRNAPSLANVAYHPYYTREGGVPSLEMQVLVPIQEHNEFNTNILDIVELLKSDEELQSLSLLAYDRELDYYVIPRAISTFERSLISGNSPYDYYQTNGIGLDEKELLGKQLFFSEKTNCSSCHSGFNFTNYSFENNGLYSEYNDPGRYRLTGDSTDIALFKVPSLRNIEVTGPYMHDGSIYSLTEVIEHYNQGGNPHPNKSDFVRPLNLTEEEITALVTFLKTLTDEAFINNEKFR